MVIKEDLEKLMRYSRCGKVETKKFSTELYGRSYQLGDMIFENETRSQYFSSTCKEKSLRNFALKTSLLVLFELI